MKTPKPNRPHVGPSFERSLRSRGYSLAFWRASPSKPVITPHERSAYKIQYRSDWTQDAEYLLWETIGWTDHGHLESLRRANWQRQEGERRVEPA